MYLTLYGGPERRERVVLDADVRDSDGLLKDIQVIDIDATERSRREDKSRDVDHFFGAAYTSDKKRQRDCHICLYGSIVSTLRNAPADPYLLQ